MNTIQKMVKKPKTNYEKLTPYPLSNVFFLFSDRQLDKNEINEIWIIVNNKGTDKYSEYLKQNRKAV